MHYNNTIIIVFTNHHHKDNQNQIAAKLINKLILSPFLYKKTQTNKVQNFISEIIHSWAQLSVQLPLINLSTALFQKYIFSSSAVILTVQ